MEIKKVGVVGCGLMGGGITEVCARAGYDVVTLEVKQEFLDKGIGNIRTSLERGVKKGRLTEQEQDAIAARIKGTLNMEDFRDRDIVIEAAIENMAERRGYSPAWTRFVRRIPSWPPTHPACPFWTWPSSPRGRPRSWGCTSSARWR